MNVVIAYTSHTQPDGKLLEVVEAALRKQQHSVFVDRHITVGLEWAKEVDHRIVTADAVIVLLSTVSVQSELLAYEVELAHAVARQCNKPVLLPVRINYSGELPPALAGVLGALEHSTWNGTKDNERMIEKLLDGLRSPPPPRYRQPNLGGDAVSLGLKSGHMSEQEFRAAIDRKDGIIIVKAPLRDKKPLLIGGLKDAQNSGSRIILTNLGSFAREYLQSAEFPLVLAESLSDVLNLQFDREKYCNTQRSPSSNFERFFRKEVLACVSTHIVWVLDEADLLSNCKTGGELISLFRAWHNSRSLDPEGPWSRLTIVMAYVTNADLFVTDIDQSRFNIGPRMTLEDFTLEAVGESNDQHGSPLRDKAELAQFYSLIGGQPSLVRHCLHELASREMTFATFAEQAENILEDHLCRILLLLVRNRELVECIRGILRGQGCWDGESFYRLRAAGILTGNSSEDAHVRCRLYEDYLRRHLL